jgi:hypothetical protein
VGRARPLRNDCVVDVFSNLPLPFSIFNWVLSIANLWIFS